VLGPATRAALNVTAQERLAQIEANLGRARWLPRPLPADRIEVDVGSATLRLFRGDRPTLEMKVVVGDPQHPTPMFASAVEAVIFNPPWNVPASIASKEILPRAARDPGYLARQGFVFREGGGLQQRPGPLNALGVVKFDFPSPYGVYLHDTPGKGAFLRERRALSHGCMRLEKPLELAAALLGAQGFGRSDVDAAVAAGATRRVALQAPTPLYVQYRTVTANAAGEASFWPDVYGWDGKLAAALTRTSTVRVAASQAATDCAEGP
jgi:murein L,D-transpeptidase YcbB/YkuD